MTTKVKITLSAVLVFLIYFSPLTASNIEDGYKKSFEKANFQLYNQMYTKALDLFLKIDSLYPDNSNINFKIGLCYYNLPTNKLKSIPFFEKAVKNLSEKYNEKKATEKNAPYITLYYLAQVYHLNYSFDNALTTFNQFKTFIGTTDIQLNKEVDNYIKMCNNGKMFVNAPIQIEITNIGEKINSVYPEYAPVISADESVLIFTSRRPESAGGKKTEDGQYFEDIYISTKENGEWSTPVSISPNINTAAHEASVGLSVDGQSLLLYKSEGPEGNIYISKLIGDKWEVPVKLSENITGKSWEPSASISADGNSLYFTSDRKGGFGGRDIYKSKKLPNGDWSLPVNMGPEINTEFDEDGPFIHPDGKTLFFSSKGHSTMGGFDVFFSIMDENGKFQKPSNLGYPVNTTDDDIYYSLSADGKRAYYSSSKEGGFGEKDLYLLNFIEHKETPLALIKGTILDVYGNVPLVDIIVTDNETEEIVGIYYPNTKTGNYLFILPPGANYNISYEAEGYLFKSENIDVPIDANYYVINQSINLQLIEIGQKIVLNNIFFDFGKSTLRSTSKVELQKLYTLLEKNPSLTVEISGHTDHIGSKEMNVKLSQERAQAVVTYITEKGMGGSRLLAKGFGSAQPLTNGKNNDGSDNPEGMQLNRRVEMKIIGINK
ncbi:MAG: PD40 domain-containing protein [Bacteroidetes bacterium]|nr:PD40 domain-containing protein [Bacteroidota bacterium]HET6243416.1 OmpA family protein [Bacteroidia bacterium]